MWGQLVLCPHPPLRQIGVVGWALIGVCVCVCVCTSTNPSQVSVFLSIPALQI